VIEIEESIDVALPRERVFEFAARPENMPLWNPVVQESKALGDLEEGTEVVQRVDLFGRRFQTTYEVTCYEPNDRIVYTSRTGPVEVQGTMEFQRAKDGTRVRWSVAGDCRSLFRVAESVLIGMGRPEMRTCLENLKGVLEQAEPGEDGEIAVYDRRIPVPAPSVISQGRRLFSLVTSLVAQKS
jgi:uncharacterized protein YndB with AHSA1/START domain